MAYNPFAVTENKEAESNRGQSSTYNPFATETSPAQPADMDQGIKDDSLKLDTEIESQVADVKNQVGAQQLNVEKPSYSWGRAGGQLVEGSKDVVRNAGVGLGVVFAEKAKMITPEQYLATLDGEDIAELRLESHRTGTPFEQLVAQATIEENEREKNDRVAQLVNESGRRLLNATNDAEWLKANPEYFQSAGFWEDLLRATPQVAAQILVSIPTGGTGGMAFMGAQIMGSSYSNAVAQGATHEQAMAKGFANAIMQAPLEHLGMLKVLRKGKPMFGSFWKPKAAIIRKLQALGTAMGAEGLTEFLQQIPEHATNLWSGDADGELLNQLWDTLTDVNELKKWIPEGLHAAAIGAILGGAGHVATGQFRDMVEDAETGKEVPPDENTPIEEQVKPKRDEKDTESEEFREAKITDDLEAEVAKLDAKRTATTDKTKQESADVETDEELFREARTTDAPPAEANELAILEAEYQKAEEDYQASLRELEAANAEVELYQNEQLRRDELVQEAEESEIESVQPEFVPRPPVDDDPKIGDTLIDQHVAGGKPRPFTSLNEAKNEYYQGIILAKSGKVYQTEAGARKALEKLLNDPESRSDLELAYVVQGDNQGFVIGYGKRTQKKSKLMNDVGDFDSRTEEELTEEEEVAKALDDDADEGEIKQAIDTKNRMKDTAADAFNAMLQTKKSPFDIIKDRRGSVIKNIERNQTYERFQEKWMNDKPEQYSRQEWRMLFDNGWDMRQQAMEAGGKIPGDWDDLYRQHLIEQAERKEQQKGRELSEVDRENVKFLNSVGMELTGNETSDTLQGWVDDLGARGIFEPDMNRYMQELAADQIQREEVLYAKARVKKNPKFKYNELNRPVKRITNEDGTYTYATATTEANPNGLIDEWTPSQPTQEATAQIAQAFETIDQKMIERGMKPTDGVRGWLTPRNTWVSNVHLNDKVNFQQLVRDGRIKRINRRMDHLELVAAKAQEAQNRRDARRGLRELSTHEENHLREHLGKIKGSILKLWKLGDMVSEGDFASQYGNALEQLIIAQKKRDIDDLLPTGLLLAIAKRSAITQAYEDIRTERGVKDTKLAAQMVRDGELLPLREYQEEKMTADNRSSTDVAIEERLGPGDQTRTSPTPSRGLAAAVEDFELPPRVPGNEPIMREGEDAEKFKMRHDQWVQQKDEREAWLQEQFAAGQLIRRQDLINKQETKTWREKRAAKIAEEKAQAKLEEEYVRQRTQKISEWSEMMKRIELRVDEQASGLERAPVFTKDPVSVEIIRGRDGESFAGKWNALNIAEDLRKADQAVNGASAAHYVVKKDPMTKDTQKVNMDLYKPRQVVIKDGKRVKEKMLGWKFKEAAEDVADQLRKSHPNAEITVIKDKRDNERWAINFQEEKKVKPKWIIAKISPFRRPLPVKPTVEIEHDGKTAYFQKNEDGKWVETRVDPKALAKEEQETMKTAGRSAIEKKIDNQKARITKTEMKMEATEDENKLKALRQVLKAQTQVLKKFHKIEAKIKEFRKKPEKAATEVLETYEAIGVTTGTPLADIKQKLKDERKAITKRKMAENARMKKLEEEHREAGTWAEYKQAQFELALQKRALIIEELMKTHVRGPERGSIFGEVKTTTVDKAISDINKYFRKNAPTARDYYNMKKEMELKKQKKKGGIMSPRHVRRLKNQILREKALAAAEAKKKPSAPSQSKATVEDMIVDQISPETGALRDVDPIEEGKKYNPLKNEKGGAEVEIPSLRERAKNAKASVAKGAAWARKSIIGAISVTQKFKGWGDETGRAIKAYHSIIEYQHEMTKKRIRELVKTLRRDIKISGVKLNRKQKKEWLADVALMAEDDAYAGQLMAKDPKKAIILANSAMLMRDFFRDARAWSKQREIEGFDFVENARRKVLNAFVKARDEHLMAQISNDPKAVAKADAMMDRQVKRWNKLKTVHFVHVPIATWFPEIAAKKAGLRMSARKKHKASRINETIDAIKDRNVLTIESMVAKGMLDKTDVDPIQIMMSYADNIGQAHALANIRDAAIQDGLIKKTKNKPRSKKDLERYWERGGKRTVFEGMYIDSRVVQAAEELHNSTQPESAIWRAWTKAVAQTKMMQFYNPVFMPMYDVYQSLFMARGILHLPTWGKNLAAAMYHTWKKDGVWQEAMQLNTFSKPHSNPMASTKRNEAMLKAHRSNVMGSMAAYALQTARGLMGFKGRGMPIITEAYNLSWDLAWNMDQVIRLTTYGMNKDLGMSNRAAAEVAARVHADYADVPARMRKALNKVLFTPTYFLSMLKVQTRMINEVTKWAINLPTGGHFKQDEQQGALAMGALVSAAALMALNEMNKAAGYDEDEWGRKWVKRVPGTGKEITLNMTNPLNKNIKYLYWVKAMTDPGELNPVHALIQRMKWEATPLWRIGIQALDNRKNNGDKIYPKFAKWHEKWLDTMIWGFQEVFKMIEYPKNIYQAATGTPTLFEETRPELRRALANDVNNIHKIMEGMGLAFIGQRTQKKQRQSQKIKHLGRELRREIVDQYIRTGKYEREEIKAWIKDAKRRMRELKKDMD